MALALLHCLLFDPTNPASARYNLLPEVRKGAQGRTARLQWIMGWALRPLQR